jgi:hypothetical protein
MAADPVAAVALAVRVSVLPLVAGLGLNAAVMPLGKPVAERVTLPLKPDHPLRAIRAMKKSRAVCYSLSKSLVAVSGSGYSTRDVTANRRLWWRSKTLQGRMTRTWVGGFQVFLGVSSLGIR